MTTTADIISRVRLELGDLPQVFTETFIADGVSTARKLAYYPVSAASITGSINGTVINPATISAEERTGRVVFTAPPAVGATVVLTGTHFRYFDDADLTTFVNEAMNQHTVNRTDAYGRTITMGNLSAVEDYPLALLATINALYALATDASFDIDIYAPDGVNIPRSERFRQLTEMISTRQQQYQALSEALGIGLYATQVYNLRRISRMTERYVPVFVPQEIDNRTPPTRAHLPIPSYGAIPVPSSSQNYDLVTTQGDAFAVTLQFSFDLTGYTLSSQVRSYVGNPVLGAQFAITVVDAPAGIATLALTPTQTMNLPLESVWDCQVTNNADATDVRTPISGKVFTNRQVTTS